MINREVAAGFDSRGKPMSLPRGQTISIIDMMGQAIMNSPALIALVTKIFIKPGSSITKSIGRYM